MCSGSAVPRGETLAGLLIEGAIDALYTPRVPAPFAAGHPAVRRLWPDPRPVEEAYFRQTGIFPIMHTLVLWRDVYQRNRWLAGSLVKAFAEAKDRAAAQAGETAALGSMLPWSYADAEATRELMGDDFWPYGIPDNQHVLRTFLGYLHDQQLTGRRWDPAELFAPETHDAFLV